MFDLSRIDVSLTLSIISAIVALIAIGWAFVLQRRLSAIEALRRKIAASGSLDMESLLQSNLTGLGSATERLDVLEAETLALIQRQRRDLQHVGVIRFNPYQDTGGDQSFSIALLDALGDGVVISGLYARQGVRLYAKPIQGGQSSYPLSDEEKQAIAQAQRQPEAASA